MEEIDTNWIIATFLKSKNLFLKLYAFDFTIKSWRVQNKSKAFELQRLHSLDLAMFFCLSAMWCGVLVEWRDVWVMFSNVACFPFFLGNYFFSVKNVSCRETAQQGNQLLLLLVSHDFSLRTKRYVVFIFKDIIGIFYYYSSKNE